MNEQETATTPEVVVNEEEVTSADAEVKVEITDELREQLVEEAAKAVEARQAAVKKFRLSPSESAAVGFAKADTKAAKLGWLKGVFFNDAAEVRKHASNLSFKAVKEGTDNIGGYLVPEEFDSEIFAAMDQYSEIISNANIKVMRSNVMRLNELTTKVNVHKGAELANVTASTPTWAEPVLTLEKYVGSTIISEEMIEDAEVDILAQIREQYAEQLAYQLQTSFMTSSVSGSEGILQASGVTTVAAATGGSYTNVKWEDLSAMKYKLMSVTGYKAEAERGKFYMNPLTWESLITNTTTTNGFVGTINTFSPNGDVRRTAWGQDVVLLNEITAPTTTAVKYVVYSDLSRHFVVGRGRSMRIKVNTSGTAADGTELNYQDARELVLSARFAQVVAKADGIVTLLS